MATKEKPEQITIAQALLKAQMEMGNAKKDATNPFFKSKYADLNSIREACMPALNNNGIVVLQPTVIENGKNYVKTLLLHENGESMECLTEIVFSKPNDAQAQGSGITYARRYGLQSFVNVGADDDDGTKASAMPKTPDKPYMNENSEQFTKAKEYIEKGGSIAEIEKKYYLSETIKKLLTN
jgi:Tfp pilus assembly protein PilZ